MPLGEVQKSLAFLASMWVWSKHLFMSFLDSLPLWQVWFC